MALYTADGLFCYDFVMSTEGISLLEHANRLNAYLASLNGWAINGPLRRGQWGLDINVWRIGYTVLMMNKGEAVCIDEVAKYVHDGWAMCFSYWSRNKPWLTTKSLYSSPGKSLVSRNKVHRAKTPYDKLDTNQKKICLQIATYIMKCCW